jgi:hypothetical protein
VTEDLDEEMVELEKALDKPPELEITRSLVSK